MAIDIIIAILIIVAVVTGAIRGLVRQLGTLVAFIVAILACRFFAPGLAQTGAWTLPLGTVLRACVYVLVFIVAFLSVNLIAKLLHATVSALSLSPLDRVAGAIFRAALWIVIASACLNVYFQLAPQSRSAFLDSSRPWRAWILKAAPATVGFIGNQ